MISAVRHASLMPSLIRRITSATLSRISGRFKFQTRKSNSLKVTLDLVVTLKCETWKLHKRPFHLR